MTPRTSGIDPPVKPRVRTADEVAPRVEEPPAVAAKPPSGFCRAATYSAVRDNSAGVCARATGATTRNQAARPVSTRFMTPLAHGLVGNGRRTAGRRGGDRPRRVSLPGTDAFGNRLARRGRAF